METPASAEAALAREVNSQIRTVAESFAAKGDERHEYVFFCECGCLLPVRLTLEAVLNTQRVLLNGHQPRHPDPLPAEQLSTSDPAGTGDGPPPLEALQRT